MTGKTLSDLGKNPGKASRQSLTSVACAKNSSRRGRGGAVQPQDLPTFKLENSISSAYTDTNL